MTAARVSIVTINVVHGVSSADNFSLEFDLGMRVDEQALFLGAVFLIDFVHFEHTG